MLTIDLLSCQAEPQCPSINLSTVPADVLDLNIIGLYPVNDQLNESVDQFLNKVATYIEENNNTMRPFLQTQKGGSTLWMGSDDSKQIQSALSIDRPLNIHETLRTNPIGLRYTVTGDYLYYHYSQDSCNDNGWGCAYRSMQTLLSHLLMNASYTGVKELQQSGKSVPTHKKI